MLHKCNGYTVLHKCCLWRTWKRKYYVLHGYFVIVTKISNFFSPIRIIYIYIFLKTCSSLNYWHCWNDPLSDKLCLVFRNAVMFLWKWLGITSGWCGAGMFVFILSLSLCFIGPIWPISDLGWPKVRAWWTHPFNVPFFPGQGQLIVWMTLPGFQSWPVGAHWGPFSPGLNVTLSISAPLMADLGAAIQCVSVLAEGLLGHWKASDIIILQNNESDPIWWHSQKLSNALMQKCVATFRQLLGVINIIINNNTKP